MDTLILRFNPFAALSPNDRQLLAKNARILEAPAGSTIVKVGEKSDAAFFVMQGQTVAGVEQDGETLWLETMGQGDFFGEIAALSGLPRTANVIAQEPTILLQVPAQTLRHLMSYPSIGQTIRLKFFERLTRTNLHDLPRFAGFDQATLRELRTVEAVPA
jgi:CRP-like cAMP-binding protein